MKKQKFNLIELATDAFSSCEPFSNEKKFVNSYTHPTRFLVVTNKLSKLIKSNGIFSDYFKSEQYEEATQKKIHILDLDEIGDYKYDHTAIKICKVRKFKSMSSVSRTHELTKIIAANKIRPINNIEIDDTVRYAFDESLHPQDFFKFQEVRYEYRISISFVRNRKIVKTVKCNLGHFTLIFTSQPYDYLETESVEKKADRPSLLNPVYDIDGVQTMVTFNSGNKYYKSLLGMTMI